MGAYLDPPDSGACDFDSVPDDHLDLRVYSCGCERCDWCGAWLASCGRPDCEIEPFPDYDDDLPF